jgi:hypothetical protein
MTSAKSALKSDAISLARITLGNAIGARPQSKSFVHGAITKRECAALSIMSAKRALIEIISGSMTIGISTATILTIGRTNYV